MFISLFNLHKCTSMFKSRWLINVLVCYCTCLHLINVLDCSNQTLLPQVNKRSILLIMHVYLCMINLGERICTSKIFLHQKKLSQGGFRKGADTLMISFSGNEDWIKMGCIAGHAQRPETFFTLIIFILLASALYVSISVVLTHVLNRSRLSFTGAQKSTV